MYQKKKATERTLLRMCLECMGEDPEAWNIEEETERPDFILRSPQGQRIGLEMTELLTTEQGRDRAADNDVASIIRRVISEFLRKIGGTGGAIVQGTTGTLPKGEPVGLEALLHAYLAANKDALAINGGVLEVPFCHDCGQVVCIERCDSQQDVLLLEESSFEQLPYKRPRAVPDIQAAIDEAVVGKVHKAQLYRQGVELWLAIRNPNQNLQSVPSQFRIRIQEINQGIFARIVLFNLRQDVIDAHPPRPRFLDLLT